MLDSVVDSGGLLKGSNKLLAVAGWDCGCPKGVDLFGVVVAGVVLPNKLVVPDTGAGCKAPNGLLVAGAAAF